MSLLDSVILKKVMDEMKPIIHDDNNRHLVELSLGTEKLGKNGY